MALNALLLAVSCILIPSRCFAASWDRRSWNAGTTQDDHHTWLKNGQVRNRRLQQQQQQQQQELIGTTTVGTLGYWGASVGTDLVPDLGGQSVLAIASGCRFVVALLQNKSVVAWGDPYNYQLDIPVEARAGPVKAIAAGNGHTLALLETGRVVQWGAANAGTVPPEAQQNVTAIWAGNANSFTELYDGRIIGWGTLQSIKRILPSLQDVRYLAETAANGHIILFNNGTLLNSTTDVGMAVPPTPLVLQGVHSAAVSMESLDYGSPHFIIVLEDGNTVAWGGNGDNRAAGANGLSDVAAAAASVHSLVLYNNGSIEGFGLDKYGEVSMPPNLPTSSPVVAIAAGDTHSVVLRADGSMLVWGRLYAVLDPILPQSVKAPAAIVSVSSSWYHSLVLKADGSVTAFGVNFTGETGVPQTIQNTAIAISAGRNHSVVLTRTGRVVSFGALKDSDVPPAALSGVVAIAAGGLFSIAVKNDSSVVVWGTSPNITACGLNAIPTANTAQIKQISAGNDHVLALLSDGSVRAWGCGPAAVVPSNIANSAVAVSAANQHSVVLLQTGKIVYFGSDYGSNGLSTTLSMLSGITLIAAGTTGICTMTSDGQLAYNGVSTKIFDQLSSSNGTTATSLAMGTEFVLAVVVPSTTQPTNPMPSPPPQHVFPKAAVAAIVAGVLVIVVAAIGVAWWFKQGRPRKQPKTEDCQPPYDGVVTCVLKQEVEKPLVIPGLLFGEVFINTTARAYVWADTDSGLDPSYAVEHGVNDIQLDQLLKGKHHITGVESQAHSPHCPVVQLTQEQLRQQIKLLPDGLLGRGATAYCFKCVWPSRFGNALLAAKILKEGLSPDINSLQSFAYEASVLENAIHPNVVRLYGYCLEPPAVCLILELMPYSLKDLLYKHHSTVTHVTIHDSTLAGIDHSQSHHQPCSVTAASDPTMHARTAHSIADADMQTRYYTANSRFSCSGGGATSGFTTASTFVPTKDDLTMASNDRDTHALPSSITAQHNDSVAGKVFVKSRLSMLQVLRYSSDIAAGLAYLHSTPVRQVVTDSTEGASGDAAAARDQRSSRIVHRDLKPANVMISWRGVAKLSDFGLARQHDNTTLITSGVGAGTLPYMAPELLVARMAGMPHYNPTNRVDIYSMAMMMWEMLSGQTPWDGVNEAAMITAVISGRRPELLGAAPSTQSVFNPSTQASLSSVPDEFSNIDKVEQLLTSQRQLNVPLSTLPASLDALPEFNAIIKACWHHRELKRPTAAAVSEILKALLAKYMAQERIAS